MNAIDILLIAALALVILLAIRRVLKNKKHGSCCGDCTACRAHCTQKEENR